MLFIQPPEEYSDSGMPCLFLAGSITGAADWQSEALKLLSDSNIVVFNPRRENFDSAAEEQIRWEHRYLRKADAISFWFAKGSMSPITLYELGTWSSGSKPIFVGVHPEYQKRKDVEVQTMLVRPDVKIVYNLEDLIAQVKGWAKAQNGL